MPEISVLMPIYNPNEQFLQLAVESILNQTFKDFEFIIYDDGSEIDSKKLIDKYNDKRIKFIQGEHHGLGYSLNTLVNLASCKYIARMDADDISYPERLREQYEFMESHPDISILGTDIETFPKKRIIRYKERPGYIEFLKYCHIAHPTVMIRKSDLQKYNLNYDKNIIAAEDYDLWSRAVKYLNFANLPKVLLKYRVHENSTTKRCNFAMMKQNYIIRKRMLEFLSKEPEIQNKIKNLIENNGILKSIFQIKNEFYNDEYYKIVKIFGLKIKIYKKF